MPPSPPPPAQPFEIFLAALPGLETELRAEARAVGLGKSALVKGGVTLQGGWHDVWRANLELRGASRVLARFASFPAEHLWQLDKRARKIDWAALLRPDIAVNVEASCRASHIYHSGAAAERIGRAITESLGAPLSRDAPVTVMARIDSDQCTLSVDTSGDLLHKRGHKAAVSKAPIRETMAALLLRRCGFNGGEPLLDPMCGSGTFVIEAAEMALGLKPGRSRSFAFEQLATFDVAIWREMREAAFGPTRPAPAYRFHGSDRDAGAIRMSRDNAARAGVSDATEFQQLTVSELHPPDGPAGLVMVNPPYGDRIGDKSKLQPLYRSLGQTLLQRFAGWRVGLVTSEPTLARATGLPFTPPSAPIAHGGLRVQLFQTPPLP
jgi:putative N6-adenine-specific DNA methylase